MRTQVPSEFRKGQEILGDFGEQETYMGLEGGCLPTCLVMPVCDLACDQPENASSGFPGVWELLKQMNQT
jgi:hypothetical protein